MTNQIAWPVIPAHAGIQGNCRALARDPPLSRYGMHTSPETHRKIFPLPLWVGASHMTAENCLCVQEKWILKGSPDSQGDADGPVPRKLWRRAGPSGGEFAARFGRALVHCPAGVAVRSDQLQRHGGVWASEGAAAAHHSDARAWDTEPRHVQSRIPHARPKGIRTGVSALHEGVGGGGEDRRAEGGGGPRWQVAAAGLRAGPELLSAPPWGGLGGRDTPE